MAKIGRKWLDLIYGSSDSVRAQDIPYDEAQSIKDKVDSIVGGNGDMYKATYDTDDDGVVDNSEALEGNTLAQVRNHSPISHASSHQSGGSDQISVANLTGVLADRQYAISEAGIDTSAIHDNEAGEIVAITEKISVKADDQFLLEDSEDSWNKKHVRLGNLLGGGGGLPVWQFPFFSNTTPYKEVTSSNWEPVGDAIFRGSDEITPAIMKVIASRSSDTGSSELRLYDWTNDVEIGVVTVINTGMAIYTDSSLGTLPTSDAIFEVQGRIISGGKPRIHFLGLY